MNTEKIVKESKVIMLVTLITGIVILAVGVIFNFIKIDLVNNKAIMALSLTPLSMAFVYYLKLSAIKKSPQKMRDIIITESDERLVAVKNEANSQALKIQQGALFLTYMGYTLMVPGDVFESIGWWILMILLLVSFMSQAILLAIAMGKEKGEYVE